MRWKEGQSEPSSKLWLLLLLLLLPQSPERGSPVQGPGKKAEGYRQTRLATCGGPPCRTGVLEVVEPQGRRLARGEAHTDARGVFDKLAVRKTKHTIVAGSKCWPATRG